MKRTAKLRNVMVHASFEMTTLDKIFRMMYPNQLINAMGPVRVSQKHLRDGAFCYQNEDSTRAFFHVIIIYFYKLLWLVFISRQSLSGLVGKQQA